MARFPHFFKMSEKARFLCEIFQILKVGKEFIFLENENCSLYTTSDAEKSRICASSGNPPGTFSWLSGSIYSILRTSRATIVCAVWNQKYKGAITKAGERPPCLVAQGVHCTRAPNHQRGKSADMQPTEGEFPDGWIKLITSSPIETTRYDVPPREATGNTQHHRRIILAKTKPPKPNLINPLLDQGSSNCDLPAKASLPPGFVNKVSLRPRHTYLSVYLLLMAAPTHQWQSLWTARHRSFTDPCARCRQQFTGNTEKRGAC